MRKPKRISLAAWLFVLFISLLSACNQKCIVVSDSSLYHVRSGDIIEYSYDSSLMYYDEIHLSSKELKAIIAMKEKQ